MATRRRGAARPVESGVDPVHLHEVLPPQGAFVGHLTITRVFLVPRMPMRDSWVAAPTDVGCGMERRQNHPQGVQTCQML